jgi:hypothetical protein
VTVVILGDLVFTLEPMVGQVPEDTPQLTEAPFWHGLGLPEGTVPPGIEHSLTVVSVLKADPVGERFAILPLEYSVNQAKCRLESHTTLYGVAAAVGIG